MNLMIKEKIIPWGAGLLIVTALAMLSQFLSTLIPMGLVSGGVFAMLIGMALHPLVKKIKGVGKSFTFCSKRVLKLSIIMMGVTLSFAQVLEVGKFSLIVMCFTLLTAFGGGYLLGKLFKMNWRLSGLISAGTGICGGSAIAAISPAVEAEDSDIAYAISATFIFDIVMVLLFPIMGKAFGMSDLGYGLWAGTAVNDTSSVVAAGFAFSDAAGNFAIIVKLTRTLSIIPVVLIFSMIHIRQKKKQARFSLQAAVADAQGAGAKAQSEAGKKTKTSECAAATAFSDAAGPQTAEDNINGSAAVSAEKPQGEKASDAQTAVAVTPVKINYLKIIPWFILGFLAMVAINSLGFIPQEVAGGVSKLSKFFMIAALGAIGLSTDFRKVAKSGFKPMLHGFIISALVVVVAFLVQLMLGQM